MYMCWKFAQKKESEKKISKKCHIDHFFQVSVIFWQKARRRKNQEFGKIFFDILNILHSKDSQENYKNNGIGPETL
jgi:hypothetical protein